MIEILLNGVPRAVAPDTSVAALLAGMNLGGRIALELNREILPRSQHASVRLQAGDRVEIVQAVGGG
jgi:thiamine biosynthesis protein ThiS